MDDDDFGGKIIKKLLKLIFIFSIHSLYILNLYYFVKTKP